MKKPIKATIRIALFILFISPKVYALTFQTKIQSTNGTAVLKAEDLERNQYRVESNNQSIEFWTRVLELKKKQIDKNIGPHFPIGGFRGHATVQLMQQNGKYYLHLEQTIDDEVDGIRLNYFHETFAEVTFIQGNWTEYLENRRVKLKLTHPGLEQFKKFYIAELQYLIDSVTKNLEDRFPESKPKSKITKVKIHNNYVIKGTLDKLEVQYPDVTSVTEIELNLIGAVLEDLH